MRKRTVKILTGIAVWLYSHGILRCLSGASIADRVARWTAPAATCLLDRFGNGQIGPCRDGGRRRGRPEAGYPGPEDA